MVAVRDRRRVRGRLWRRALLGRISVHGPVRGPFGSLGLLSSLEVGRTDSLRCPATLLLLFTKPSGRLNHSPFPRGRQMEHKLLSEPQSRKAGITEIMVLLHVVKPLQENNNISPLSRMSGKCASSSKRLAVAKQVLHNKATVLPASVDSSNLTPKVSGLIKFRIFAVEVPLR